MPESIRNAIVVAFIAVLVAMVGVGLLLWTRRPAAPSRAPAGLPLLVNDRDGGIYDLSVKLRQMERRLGEDQVLTQRLMEQLQEAGVDRARLTNRLTGLEKEVRVLRKRVQGTEQLQAPKQPAEQTVPGTTTSPSPPSTSSPANDLPVAPPR